MAFIIANCPLALVTSINMTGMMIVLEDFALTCKNSYSFDDGGEESLLEYP